MGYTTAEGWAHAVLDGHVDIHTAVEQHLTCNCFPPINPVFVPVAVASIAAVRDGNYNLEVTLPQGKEVTAEYVVGGLHLEAFINAEPEGYRNHAEDIRTRVRRTEEGERTEHQHICPSCDTEFSCEIRHQVTPIARRWLLRMCPFTGGHKQKEGETPSTS